MLLSLSLRHFVLVDTLNLSFDAGFSALTGETGAGKSIILDALSLLLGDRADFSQIRQGADEAHIAALFSLADAPAARQILADAAWPGHDEDELMIRRVIDRKGKSRHFVNDQAATLAFLKNLGRHLIDIHGQNAHYSLNQEATQRHIMDAFSGCLTLAQSVAEHYRTWQKAQQKLANAKESEATRQETYEALRRQWQEFDAVQPCADEFAMISQQYDTLAHAADLLQAAEASRAMLDDDDGVQTIIARIMQKLNPLAAIEPRFAEALQILASAEAELGEVSGLLRDVLTAVEVNPQELAQFEDRMATLASLAKKYRIDTDQLAAYFAQLQERLQQFEAESNIEALEEAVTAAAETYQQAAEALSEKRRDGALRLGNEVSALMHDLAMQKARFGVELLPTEASAAGNERIQFQVATNPGMPMAALAKIASGGELARIGLAIQVVCSRYTAVPTLIFDEVDSGIGGAVAQTVGDCLRQLGQHNQVLVITHLPQVAATAATQFLVEKNSDQTMTTSHIRPLTAKERVAEIARMMSGATLTDATLELARELLNH